jgi:hypothetical protein
MNKLNLGTIATAGVATMAAGWGLQQAYKATNFYPPPPVFWFAIGASASILLGLVGKPRALTG